MAHTKMQLPKNWRMTGGKMETFQYVYKILQSRWIITLIKKKKMQIGDHMYSTKFTKGEFASNILTSVYAAQKKKTKFNWNMTLKCCRTKNWIKICYWMLRITTTEKKNAETQPNVCFAGFGEWGCKISIKL